ncbi:hypothetical protein LCGC14_2053910 [marine sediment metagenome]|uniref:Uncharacterized protein n=1 Tax=marine sediment metagenome TaxID=412755 RepID=A0A0F9HK51_9ZZZZ
MRDLAPGEKIRPHRSEDVQDVVTDLRQRRLRHRLIPEDEVQLLSHLLFIAGFVILENEE